MTRREASINDLQIDAADRRIFGPRPQQSAATNYQCSDRCQLPHRSFPPYTTLASGPDAVRG